VGSPLRLRCPRPRSEAVLLYFDLRHLRGFRRSRDAETHFLSEDRGVAGADPLQQGYLLLRKLAREVTFNIFTAKRVFCFGQHYRIDDLITGKLSGDKCSVLRQFLVSEFHFLAAFKCFDPLVAHLAPPSGDSTEIIRPSVLRNLFASGACLSRLNRHDTRTGNPHNVVMSGKNGRIANGLQPLGEWR
jgi:hypothetical protein